MFLHNLVSSKSINVINHLKEDYKSWECFTKSLIMITRNLALSLQADRNIDLLEIATLRLSIRLPFSALDIRCDDNQETGYVDLSNLL